MNEFPEGFGADMMKGSAIRRYDAVAQKYGDAMMRLEVPCCKPNPLLPKATAVGSIYRPHDWIYISQNINAPV